MVDLSDGRDGVHAGRAASHNDDVVSMPYAPLSSCAESSQVGLGPLRRKIAQPIAGLRLNKFNGSRGTGLCTGGLAIAEIAFDGFIAVRIVEDGAVRTGDGAELTAHTLIFHARPWPPPARW